MKKICASVMVIVMTLLASISAYAQEESYTLSLKDAIEMATKDNPLFVSADTKITNAEKQLQDAKYDQRHSKGPVRLPEGLQLAAIQKGYYVEQAQIGLEQAKREKTQSEAGLAYEVTQKYYSLKLAEELVKSSENAYRLAAENKSNMDVQFSLGLVAELDVNSASYAVMQAETTKESYKRNYDIAKKNLMISLGIDNYNTSLILTDGIEFKEFETDVEKDITAAMDTRLDVYLLKSVYDQSVLYIDVARLLGVKSAEYSAANQSMVQNEYTFSNTKKLIGLSINVQYNDILNARDKVKLSEENLRLRTQEYNIAKLNSELGMITNTQLTAALNNVTAAEIELENAKLTYKLAVEKYGYEISIGLKN